MAKRRKRRLLARRRAKRAAAEYSPRRSISLSRYSNGRHGTAYVVGLLSGFVPYFCSGAVTSVLIAVTLYVLVPEPLTEPVLKTNGAMVKMSKTWFGTQERWVGQIEADGDARGATIYFSVSIGWPFAALKRSKTSYTTFQYEGYRAPAPLEASSWSGGIQAPKVIASLTNYRLRLIPVMPVPYGLSLNALFYGGLIWIIIAAAESAKKARRRQRGQCAMCRYDLRGLDGVSNGVCPECGTPTGITP